MDSNIPLKPLVMDPSPFQVPSNPPTQNPSQLIKAPSV